MSRYKIIPAHDKPGWFRLLDTVRGREVTGTYSTENAARAGVSRLEKTAKRDAAPKELVA